MNNFYTEISFDDKELRTDSSLILIDKIDKKQG